MFYRVATLIGTRRRLRRASFNNRASTAGWWRNVTINCHVKIGQCLRAAALRKGAGFGRHRYEPGRLSIDPAKSGLNQAFPHHPGVEKISKKPLTEPGDPTLQERLVQISISLHVLNAIWIQITYCVFDAARASAPARMSPRTLYNSDTTA